MITVRAERVQRRHVIHALVRVTALNVARLYVVAAVLFGSGSFQAAQAAQLSSPDNRAAVNPSSPDATASTGRRTAPIRITPSLVLSIPIEYIGNPSERFDFFLPELGGYTPERRKNRWDENRVTVWYVSSHDTHGAPPESVGLYPPHQIRNVLKYLADPSTHHERYDLECYPQRRLRHEEYCYGKRDENDYLVVKISLPPYSPGVVNPQMKANYFSPRYGGVEIAWTTNVKNLPHWREIDAQVWKLLATWNVASSQFVAPKP